MRRATPCCTPWREIPRWGRRCSPALDPIRAAGLIQRGRAGGTAAPPAKLSPSKGMTQPIFAARQKSRGDISPACLGGRIAARASTRPPAHLPGGTVCAPAKPAFTCRDGGRIPPARPARIPTSGCQRRRPSDWSRPARPLRSRARWRPDSKCSTPRFPAPFRQFPRR